MSRLPLDYASHSCWHLLVACQVVVEMHLHLEVQLLVLKNFKRIFFGETCFLFQDVCRGVVCLVKALRLELILQFEDIKDSQKAAM